MRKKILWTIPIFLLTCGCFTNNKSLTCTNEEKYDDIQTKITIVTKFKKGKAISSEGKALMQFETEKKAQEYYDAFDGDKSGMSLDGKNLTVITEQKLTEEDNPKTRNETLIYFENSGYQCK